MSRSMATYLTINPKANMADMLLFSFARPERPGTFIVTDAYCINPLCDCKLASLRIQELPEDGGSFDPEPAECFIHLESRKLLDAAGREVEPPKHSLLADFQVELSDEGLNLWRKHYLQARAYGREHFWDPEEFEDLGAGDMPAWHDLQPGAGSVTMREGGQRLALVEHYCLSPVCHCHEVLVGVVVLGPEVAQRLDVAQQQQTLAARTPQKALSPWEQAAQQQAQSTEIGGADLTGDEPEAIVRVNLKGSIRIEDSGPFPPAFVEKLIARYVKDAKRKKELNRRYHLGKKKGAELAERFPQLAEAWKMRAEFEPSAAAGKASTDASPLASGPDESGDDAFSAGLLDQLASASVTASSSRGVAEVSAGRGTSGVASKGAPTSRR